MLLTKAFKLTVICTPVIRQLNLLDPPENLTITDPGHLGNLEISWSPSQEQVRMKEQGQCLVLYELHYYDSYSSSWTVSSIRTTQTSFRAQFDLGQEVKVRIYTLISGACADGRTAKSKNFTEVVQKPDMAGQNGLQDFICLYYYMEHLFCSWKRSSKMPAKAQEAFYYWHREMAHTKECPFYILSGGFRSGCNFSGTDLPTFSDINLCVNMSSDDPVRPLYVTLQIQNIVKPKPPGDLRVEAGADKQLRVHWGSPAGRIPQHCLLWQVQTRREGQEEKPTQLNCCNSMYITLLMSCLRVRCMLNKYCANSGVWSDWSPSVCYPGMEYCYIKIMLLKYIAHCRKSFEIQYQKIVTCHSHFTSESKKYFLMVNYVTFLVEGLPTTCFY
uniref:Fibronectin type-III domain-containing protein n=1 Tax=Periophthalmus magnuspinnatus TaxID=409849 RepID=A0A3B4A177_9GOBI